MERAAFGLVAQLSYRRRKVWRCQQPIWLPLLTGRDERTRRNLAKTRRSIAKSVRFKLRLRGRRSESSQVFSSQGRGKFHVCACESLFAINPPKIDSTLRIQFARWSKFIPIVLETSYSMGIHPGDLCVRTLKAKSIPRTVNRS